MKVLSIREVQFDDLTRIVRIHQLAFPGFLMTLMGPRFLYEYYRSVFDYDQRIFLVAVDHEKRLCGFVAGFVDPVKFYRHFKAKKKNLIISAFLHVSIRPFLWRRVLENMRKVDCVSQTVSDSHSSISELASIAVDPTMSRCGCGKKLVVSFLNQAKIKLVNCVELTTDENGNEIVNSFYKGLGFSLDSTISRSGGRCMNKYTYDF